MVQSCPDTPTHITHEPEPIYRLLSSSREPTHTLEHLSTHTSLLHMQTAKVYETEFLNRKRVWGEEEELSTIFSRCHRTSLDCKIAFDYENSSPVMLIHVTYRLHKAFRISSHGKFFARAVGACETIFIIKRERLKSNRTGGVAVWDFLAFYTTSTPTQSRRTRNVWKKMRKIRFPGV